MVAWSGFSSQHYTNCYYQHRPELYRKLVCSINGMEEIDLNNNIDISITTLVGSHEKHTEMRNISVCYGIWYDWLCSHLTNVLP